MPPHAPQAIADGETRTSRVVGSVDFVRPKLNSGTDGSPDEEAKLTVVSGIRCSMPYTIKCLSASFGDNAEHSAVRIEQIAAEVFAECESKLSNFNAHSEVNAVNSLSLDDTHQMSDALKDVVLCSKELVKLTRGAFDPSVAPLLEHYEHMARRHSATTARQHSDSVGVGSDGSHHGDLSPIAECDDDADEDHVDAETLRRQRLVLDYWKSLLSSGFGGDPTLSKTVRRLLELSQWSSAFSVGGVEGEIRKKHSDARLDLSGIAKGWTVDRITEALPAPSYVEWAGDIRVRGCHPSGRPWIVAVPEPPTLEDLWRRVAKAKRSQQGPVFNLAADEDEQDEANDKEKEYLAILELRDGDAVATSGDYEKVIEHEGKLYSHIVNPQIGRLLELNTSTLAQAVVVAKNCMVADALATASMSKEDPSEARALLDRFRTGYHIPVRDYLLYARNGPRIIRSQIPGVEGKSDRDRRLQRHQEATVVVVGSGLAGMSAAIEAADARAKVILLEKEPKTGGNSAKATSGINGWGTDTQAEHGVADEERLFERDTFRSGLNGRTDYSLVRTLSSKSSDGIHWLKHRFGVPLTVLYQLGGHSAKRTHRAPAVDGRPVPIGWKITSSLKNAIDSEYVGKIEVRCGQCVTQLMNKVESNGSKTITGVEVNGNEVIEADAVVLATGGFGCCQNKDGLMGRFRPDVSVRYGQSFSYMR